MNEELEKITNYSVSRRALLRMLGVGGAMAALPSLVSACNAADNGANGGQDNGGQLDTLTWSLQAISGLDFYHHFGSLEQQVMSPAMEHLLTYDEEGVLQPFLAKTWEQKDPLTYVYQLRDDVTFWDGSPLTAEDVAFSMNRNTDPAVGSAIWYYTTVESVKATGPLEVTMKLKEPDPLAGHIPAFIAGFVTQRKFVEKVGDGFGSPQNLIMGTGPYQIKEFVPDDHIVFERYEGYWGEKPIFKRLVINFIPDASTIRAAFTTDQVQGTFDIALDQVDSWEKVGGGSILRAPGNLSYYLSFNMEAQPWSDIYVRRAVAHATDKNGMVQGILRGKGRVANAIQTPEQWAGLLTPAEAEQFYAELPQYEFDLTKAKSALKQSAYPDGFDATIKYDATEHIWAPVLLSLAENLGKIGIKLKVEEVPTTPFWDGILQHKDLGLEIMYFVAFNNEPSNYYSTAFASANAVPNGFNTANFKSAEIDGELAKYRSTTEVHVRTEALKNIERIAAEELPYLYLFYADRTMAIRDVYEVEGFSHWIENSPWPTRIQER